MLHANSEFRWLTFLEPPMAISLFLRSHATADGVISTLGIDLRFKPKQIEAGEIRRSSPDIGRSAVKLEESLQEYLSATQEKPGIRERCRATADKISRHALASGCSVW